MGEGGVVYLTIEEVLVLHASVRPILPSQVLDDVRDLGLLESDLARPQNAAAYEEADFASQAATLLGGIVKNHPFVDGNKRTAYVVTQTFLRTNGFTIAASEDERFGFVIAAAEGMGISDTES